MDISHQTPSTAFRSGRSALPYVQVIPPAWRALAALCYLSDFFDIAIVLPFVVWLLYPRSRFLRGHALVAGFIQGLGLLVTSLLRAPSYLFLIEENQFFITPEQFAGALFSSDQMGTLILLVLLTLAFITFVILPGVASNRSDLRIRAGRGLRVTGDELMLAALLACGLTPVLFYMQGIWGALGGAGEQTFFGLHLRYFEDPYRLFPGHMILLWCMTGVVLAVRGRLHFFAGARWLFIRLQRDNRATGEARYRAARWRTFVFPGWGQFYAGQRLAGVVTAGVLFLLALFWFISVGLNYGRMVEDLPGFNMNFAWNFLTQLGMRSHVLSDGDFRDLFGNWLALGVLTSAIALVYLHAFFATRLIFRRPGGWAFFPVISHSLLLHLVPLAIVLIVPVTVLPILPAGGSGEPSVPNSFDKPDDQLALNDPDATSGEESETEGHRNRADLAPVEIIPLPAPSASDRRPGPDPNLTDPTPERSDAQDRPQNDRRSNERESLANSDKNEEERPLPGKRKKQSYSNYLSVKIRAPEKDLAYWDQLPRPYSAVFEYTIEADGRVHSVRIVEPSGHPDADRLTLRLIETMGTVLPPPGEQPVVVTELFWNTGVDDATLPTELQRELSREFDGRVIELMR